MEQIVGPVSHLRVYGGDGPFCLTSIEVVSVKRRSIMAIKRNSSKRPSQGDLLVRLIGTLTEALAKLITTSASTIAILGILVILAIVVLRAAPEMQQQIIPSLLSILSMMIGRMLASQETSPPKPPETPGPSG